jgi:hypothetical protein
MKVMSVMAVEGEGGSAGSGRGRDSDSTPRSYSPQALDIPDESTSIPKLKRMEAMLNTVYTSVMQEGTDYDILPGTSKPGLLKAGAELLARLFNIVADTQIVSRVEKTEQEVPYFQYDAECRLSNARGEFVGNGVGSCNSAEPQYAFKWVFQEELTNDIRSPEELRTREVGGKKQYRVPSSREEVFGFANSIKKKAKKRAFVDAVLTVTGGGRIFTQDVGDEGSNDDEHKNRVKARGNETSGAGDEKGEDRSSVKR